MLTRRVFVSGSMTAVAAVSDGSPPVAAQEPRAKAAADRRPPPAKRILASGRRALVPFRTSPFPYSGLVPATGKPFLDIVLEDRSGRFARSGAVYWADETYSDQRVLLSLPRGFTLFAPGVLVVFFHGNGATLERDVVDRQRVPAQVANAALNSALIAPQFAVDALDSSAGMFWKQGAFSAFLDEASAHLARLADARSERKFFRQLPLVLVAYSGGYHPLSFVLHHAAAERIAGVVLLDALYGDIEKFTTWLLSRDVGFFVSASTRSTADRNVELQRFLQDRQHVTLAALPEVLKPRDLVFLSTQPPVTHTDFVTRAWVDYPLQDVLSRIGGVPR